MGPVRILSPMYFQFMKQNWSLLNKHFNKIIPLSGNKMSVGIKIRMTIIEADNTFCFQPHIHAQEVIWWGGWGNCLQIINALFLTNIFVGKT